MKLPLNTALRLEVCLCSSNLVSESASREVQSEIGGSLCVTHTACLVMSALKSSTTSASMISTCSGYE